MSYKILRALYDSLPLLLYKPKSLEYRAICKKSEKLHVSMTEAFSPAQLAAVDEYADLMCRQALLEQRQAFYCGVRVGVRLRRELQFLHKRGVEK